MEDSRRNEDEADDFSIRVNWMLGNNPLLVANYYLLFATIERGLHKGTHAPSACRLEKFLNAGIHFTESAKANNNPSVLYAQAIDQVKKTRRKLSEICQKGDAMTSTTIPGLW